jgi:hypothetical protein
MAATAKKSAEYLNLKPGRLVTNKRVKKGKPPAGRKHMMYTMGDGYEAGDNWTVIMADVALYFFITQEMIDTAVHKSGRYCVIGQAFAAIFGDHIDWQVGTGEVKIWDVDAKIEVRFRTPTALQQAIRKFDPKKGRWPLPANMYRLLPIAKSSLEHRKNYKARAAAKHKKNKGSATITVRTVVRCKPVARKTASRTVLRNARIVRNGYAAA